MQRKSPTSVPWLNPFKLNIFSLKNGFASLLIKKNSQLVYKMFLLVLLVLLVKSFNQENPYQQKATMNPAMQLVLPSQDQSELKSNCENILRTLSFKLEIMPGEFINKPLQKLIPNQKQKALLQSSSIMQTYFFIFSDLLFLSYGCQELQSKVDTNRLYKQKESHISNFGGEKGDEIFILICISDIRYNYNFIIFCIIIATILDSFHMQTCTQISFN